MSKEEKAKVNIEGVATLFRNVMFSIAFLLCAGRGATLLFGTLYLEPILLFAIPVSGVIYLLIASNQKSTFESHKIVPGI